MRKRACKQRFLMIIGLCHMDGILLLLFLQLCLLYVTRAVNPACECIIFDGSHNSDHGEFTSPNYPTPYENNINCLLYTFIGMEDEIIQVTFEEFDLQKSSTLDCVFGDFVKLFLHLERAEVNEHTQWNAVLCGSVADIEKNYYSSSRSLIFEFHTDWRVGNHSGFRGTYHFIKKKLYQTDGKKINGTTCDYQFFSGNKTQKRGKFYSPRYPSSYPKHSKCSYRFSGKVNERVKVVFEKVSLQQDDSSCLNSPEDIIVHDGKDVNSPVIGQLCNTNTMVELVSTGPELYIEFNSKSHDPGQGFKASFLFEEENAVFVQEIPSTEPDKSGTEKEVIEEVELQTTLKTPVYDCNQRISSDTTKNGSLMSPNYPQPYPQRITCTYNFTGRGKERVQLIFTDFELYMAAEESRDCNGVDAVMVFININGQSKRVDNFCGSQIPAPLMSNGPSLSVEFHTFQSPGTSKGFRAIYHFVTNFGITSGRQDSQSVCGFVYNSSETTNGTFTSPNYPGYYPRDTECHYFFFGQKNERVHITFYYFDVEGMPPCTSNTASDYVEFSNFRTVDRKIPRHCGMKVPSVVESDSDFFRVTFKSNDKFDGTGFEAYYQFKNHVDPYTIKRVKASTGTGGAGIQTVLKWSLLFAIFISSEWLFYLV